MRKDMHKVVIERERWGSSIRSKKTGGRVRVAEAEDYDGPTRAPARQTDRMSTDVLNPLKGFLRKNIGRPWDKVYSELRQGLDARSVTGLHIFQHLEYMVQTNCVLGADRKMYTESGPWPGGRRRRRAGGRPLRRGSRG